MVTHLRRPAPAAWLTGRVTVLLNHYFVGPVQQVQKEVLRDWVTVLEGLPAWSVHEAVKEWLSGEDSRRRPSPGEIKALARENLESVESMDRHLNDLPRLAAAKTREELEREKKDQELQAKYDAMIARMTPEDREAYQRLCSEGDLIGSVKIWKKYH